MGAKGFEPVGSREVLTPFVFAHLAHYMDARHDTGPGQRVSRPVGAEAMTEALLDVGEQFVQADGRYHLDNTFRVVGAVPTDD